MRRMLSIMSEYIIDTSFIRFPCFFPHRFDGVAPEPRKGIRSGHVPGSKCIPFGQVIHMLLIILVFFFNFSHSSNLSILLSCVHSLAILSVL